VGASLLAKAMEQSIMMMWMRWPLREQAELVK
jgi:hypothetical protein